MKRFIVLMLTLCIAAFNLVGCTNKQSISNDTKVEGDFLKVGTEDSNYVELHKITDGIWVHTTYANYNGARTPSNGVIAVTSKGLLLIDTPWNNTQTRELIKLAKETFKEDIILAVITHAHDDRIGGIDKLLEDGIDVRSTGMTIIEAEKNGFKKPSAELKKNEKIAVGDTDIEVFYPGEGHTIDNITVWFPKDKVLFGGCLIKSMDSKSIGNTEDANVEQWPDSIKKVLEKYSDAKIIIPGHGKWGSLELINHTLELLGE